MCLFPYKNNYFPIAQKETVGIVLYTRNVLSKVTQINVLPNNLPLVLWKILFLIIIINQMCYNACLKKSYKEYCKTVNI